MRSNGDGKPRAVLGLSVSSANARALGLCEVLCAGCFRPVFVKRRHRRLPALCLECLEAYRELEARGDHPGDAPRDA